MTREIELYDTTLRDGAQAEDISFTLEDRLRIAERLDDFGIHCIEGGWPASNPRDAAFFREVRTRRFRRAKIAAFSMTRRASVRADADESLRALLETQAPVATIVGKTWSLHVREGLRVAREVNLELINDTVAYLKPRVEKVVFDAEHFFDGYADDPGYALRCLEAAAAAGADVICLCDTNGGRLPHEIAAGVSAAQQATRVPLGIHCHNDSEVAVANTMAAVRQGAVHVQGTINGFGERCGNANLCSIIANLQLKLGRRCVPPEKLQKLQELSRFVFELANIEPHKRQPYVGASAFAHKGGMHVSAVEKNPRTYEHVDPEQVGNCRRILLSDLSGRSNIVYKAREYGLDLDRQTPAVRALLRDLKDLESRGYQFEGAEASFELLMKKALNDKARYFRLLGFRVIDQKESEDAPPTSEATIMLEGPDGEVEHTAALGNGPVNALDHALRKALRRFYPEIEEVRLLDYKVRVLTEGKGTGAVVRVLIESGDEHERWGTVGVSSNVINASWQALVDSLDYKLYKDRRARGRPRSAAGARKSGRRPA